MGILGPHVCGFESVSLSLFRLVWLNGARIENEWEGGTDIKWNGVKKIYAPMTIVEETRRKKEMEKNESTRKVGWKVAFCSCLYIALQNSLVV